MRNADEFSGQRSGLKRVLPTYRRPGSGSGRIRYAHGGALPRVEPFCTVPHGVADHRGGDAVAGGVKDARDASDVRDAAGAFDGGDARSVFDGGDLGAAGLSGGDFGSGAWPMTLPATDRHADLWVLVCGGIAAVAAFTAAFVASGGASSHPATPGATMPAVVSQACPAPASTP
jgi:hypothetical protein